LPCRRAESARCCFIEKRNSVTVAAARRSRDPVALMAGEHLVADEVGVEAVDFSALTPEL